MLVWVKTTYCVAGPRSAIGRAPDSLPVWQHTFVSPSAFSRRAVVSYWRKYVHEVLVNRLGGLSLPRKSVIRLTDRPDRPDMTLDVYRGRKTTMQQQHLIVYTYSLYHISLIKGPMFTASLYVLNRVVSVEFVG